MWETFIFRVEWVPNSLVKNKTKKLRVSLPPFFTDHYIDIKKLS